MPFIDRLLDMSRRCGIASNVHLELGRRPHELKMELVIRPGSTGSDQAIHFGQRRFPTAYEMPNHNAVLG
jgi:hypothetical protein